MSKCLRHSRHRDSLLKLLRSVKSHPTADWLYAELKKDNCELLIVTGCLAQRYKDNIISDLPEVDIILGTTDYARIAEAIRTFYEKKVRFLTFFIMQFDNA